jgi:hypothetical protein
MTKIMLPKVLSIARGPGTDYQPVFLRCSTPVKEFPPLDFTDFILEQGYRFLYPPLATDMHLMEEITKCT